MHITHEHLRVIGSHHYLVKEHADLPWWRFLQRRKLQRTINHYVMVRLDFMLHED